MRRLKLTIQVLLLLSLIPFSAFGEVAYSFDVSNSYYASIPHFEDELPFRSSDATSVALGLIGYEATPWGVSLDLSSLYVTDSLPFGNYIARGFCNIGLRIRGSYQFTPIFSLFGSIGSEVNFYHKIEEAFASFSVQLGPQFRLPTSIRHHLNLTIPITVHLRKEITAPMIGIGLRYSYIPNEEHPT